MEKQPAKERIIFSLIKDLGKVLRGFHGESVFCEDVTFTQFCILDIVAERGSIGLSELHPMLSVEKSTTTRLLEPLVKKGLLERTKSIHDSRAIEIKLTKNGEDVQEKVWQCILGILDNIIQNIPENERDDVIKSIKLFIHALDKCCSGCC